MPAAQLHLRILRGPALRQRPPSATTGRPSQRTPDQRAAAEWQHVTRTRRRGDFVARKSPPRLIVAEQQAAFETSIPRRRSGTVSRNGLPHLGMASPARQARADARAAPGQRSSRRAEARCAAQMVPQAAEPQAASILRGARSIWATFVGHMRVPTWSPWRGVTTATPSRATWPTARLDEAAPVGRAGASARATNADLEGGSLARPGRTVVADAINWLDGNGASAPVRFLRFSDSTLGE